MGSMRSASIRSKEVFATCGGLLGPYLKRAPDRELGSPRLWISGSSRFCALTSFWGRMSRYFLVPCQRYDEMVIIVPDALRAGKISLARFVGIHGAGFLDGGQRERSIIADDQTLQTYASLSTYRVACL
jgi:hypothetical protein